MSNSEEEVNLGNKQEGYLSGYIPNFDSPHKKAVLLLLFEPLETRGKGNASKRLEEFEKIALEKGCKSVLIDWIVPLDNTIDKETLTNWYEKRGYKIFSESGTTLKSGIKELKEYYETNKD